MTDHPDHSDAPGRTRSAVAATRRVVGDATRALAAALRRRGGRAVFAGVTVTYVVAYLASVRDLTLGGSGFDVLVVADPVSRALVRTGAVTFEAVAVVEAGPVTYLASPGNLLVGGTLAAFAGANLAVTWLAWTEPACSVGAGSAGTLGAVAALGSGATCCAPVLFLVLGVQASSLALSIVGVAVPVAAVALVASLLYAGRRVGARIP
jgi:hypothetical protein